MFNVVADCCPMFHVVSDVCVNYETSNRGGVVGLVDLVRDVKRRLRLVLYVDTTIVINLMRHAKMFNVVSDVYSQCNVFSDAFRQPIDAYSICQVFCIVRYP